MARLPGWLVIDPPYKGQLSLRVALELGRWVALVDGVLWVFRPAVPR